MINKLSNRPFMLLLVCCVPTVLATAAVAYYLGAESAVSVPQIIAVLEGDNLWANVDTVEDVPPILVERLRHYFLTYKLIPGQEPDVSVERVYSAEHAHKVVSAAIADYKDQFGE